MNRYQQLCETLLLQPKTWLITGVAGFIGSNLLEALLKHNQRVIGLDNFSTGFQSNLDEVMGLVSPAQWRNFAFINGDIRDLEMCKTACKNVDNVLHQAALGSVPRSVADPVTTNSSNITGFLNILVAARDAQVKNFVYAASSSTYGDHTGLPKVEHRIGRPLSPYAVTKVVNELYADVFAKTYGFRSIGLRYFNVFGPRQNPHGAYSAVIPRWIESMISNDVIHINGDGNTSRDFCYINNVLQANFLAATAAHSQDRDQVFNVAYGESTSLNELFQMIKKSLLKQGINYDGDPEYRGYRLGDVMHSLADIDRAKVQLGYQPTHSILSGLEACAPWYISSKIKG